jgi:thioredoxin reductase (NADPH)
MYDVIIVGGGAAGLSAAVYTTRFKLKTLVITDISGGLISEAYKVENYLGFVSIPGHELVKKFVQHAKAFGAEMVEGQKVIKIERIKDGFKVITDSKESYEGKTLILAHGLKRRKLNIPGEKELAGKGVSYCVACDAFLFRDKVAAVIGGSNSAVTGALQLSELAKKVYLIYRRNKLRAEPIWIERASSEPNIEIIYNTNLVEIKGKDKLEHVVLDNAYKGSKILDLDGLFVEVGFVPDTSLPDQIDVETDEKGLIKIKEDCSTNIKGVYAAGDATNGSNNIEQVVTATAEGTIAAFSIYFYLKGS